MGAPTCSAGVPMTCRAAVRLDVGRASLRGRDSAPDLLHMSRGLPLATHDVHRKDVEHRRRLFIHAACHEAEGNDSEVLDAFMAEATASNYAHLLATCMEYADIS